MTDQSQATHDMPQAGIVEKNRVYSVEKRREAKRRGLEKGDVYNLKAVSSSSVLATRSASIFQRTETRRHRGLGQSEDG